MEDRVELTMHVKGEETHFPDVMHRYGLPVGHVCEYLRIRVVESIAYI